MLQLLTQSNEQESPHHHLLLAAQRREWCSTLAEVCQILAPVWMDSMGVDPGESDIYHQG